MAKEKHLGIRIDEELHTKLVYVSKYEGRSISGQVLYLINKCIREFERDNEEIIIGNKTSESDD